jgi:hypothetical protein
VLSGATTLCLHSVTRNASDFIPYDDERFGPSLTAERLVSSEGGGLLLREVEKRTAIIRQFAACFTDYRKPDLIEHTVGELSST